MERTPRTFSSHTTSSLPSTVLGVMMRSANCIMALFGFRIVHLVPQHCLFWMSSLIFLRETIKFGHLGTSTRLVALWGNVPKQSGISEVRRRLVSALIEDRSIKSGSTILFRPRDLERLDSLPPRRNQTLAASLRPHVNGRAPNGFPSAPLVGCRVFMLPASVGASIGPEVSPLIQLWNGA